MKSNMSGYYAVAMFSSSVCVLHRPAVLATLPATLPKMNLCPESDII
ncbi:hypothetical protein MKMG_00656 [Methanogenium sp. MK-MG]|nr:hypothetical protein MKMG_00656 [Methanogenium sp. MK-MG]